MADRIGYAVIGCGEHAMRGHVIPGNDVPELRLVGVFDLSDEKMVAARGARVGRTNFTRYKSEEHLLLDPEVQAVVIATPDAGHAASMLRAVAHSKHVLCEKPLAVTHADLDLLSKSIVEARLGGLVVTSCHPRRFDTPYLWLKKNLAKWREAYGQALMLELDFTYHKPSKVGLHTGLLADHFNHEFDLLNWLFGHKAAEVQRLHDSHTRYLAVGMRADGIGFSFHGTRLLEGAHFRESVRLRFERGDITLDCSNGMASIHDSESGAHFLSLAGPTDYATRFRGVMANFAAAILGREPNYLSQQDLLANAESCVALTNNIRYTYRPPS
jgi:predicted dehydrogenase